MNETNPEFELYPDEIADPSLVEAESMACEVPCNEEPPVCENLAFCGEGGCDGCSSTWTCFPVNPKKTWEDMTIEEQDIIRTHYPQWVGR